MGIAVTVEAKKAIRAVEKVEVLMLKVLGGSGSSSGRDSSGR